MKNFIFISLWVIISVRFSYGQSATANWTVSYQPSKNFIENKSQFNGKDKLSDLKILFGIDQNGTQIYFTKQGLTYRFDEKQKKDDKEEEKEREREHKKENKKTTTEDWAEH